MAPQAETGKSGWLKLATALYYCLASMTVQYMNKVCRACATPLTSLARRCMH